MKIQKGISTFFAILVVGLVALIGFVVFYSYQYIWVQEEEAKTGTVETNFSKLDEDLLLEKLFPNLSFTNGVAEHTEKHPQDLNLELKETIKDYFISAEKKSLLLVTELEGVGHTGGLYHAYLGLFDKEGNLLTSESSYPAPNYSNPLGDDYYNFSLDKAQFGGDQGNFGIYECNGIKYIVFVSHDCPNGTCCFGKAKVFKISNGRFEEIKLLGDEFFSNPSYGLKLSLSGVKMIIKKVPAVAMAGGSCPETDYMVLDWDKDKCVFE